jgi:PAS domain S-box-containing protein
MVCAGPDPIAIATLDEGRILYANDVVSALTGIPAELLVGSTPYEAGLWADPTDLVTLGEALHESGGQVDGVPFKIRTPGGEERVTHLWLHRCTYAGQDAVVAMARDTTESSHTEELLALEHEITRLMAGARTARDAIMAVLATTGSRLDLELGAHWLADDRLGILTCTELWCSPLAELPGLAAATAGRRLHLGEDLPGWAWERAAPVWLPDPAGHPRVRRVPAGEASAATAAFAFPVLAEDRVTGILEFFSRGPLPSDDALVETAEAIGRQLGQILRFLEQGAQRS